MHFALIDTVVEAAADRVVAIKNVTLAEEYLGDHFPGFPVLPGVFMVEAMVQAARHLLTAEGHGDWVLGQARSVRYGSFVRPGESLRVEVTVVDRGDESVEFKGIGVVLRNGTPSETAVSGRLTMRPQRM